MSTIAILKQIVDLLYEESKYNDMNTLKIKLKAFEREIQEKNTEIAQLCTENIKMENMLKKYEMDFEMLSNMTGYTQQQTEEEPEQKNETKINETSEKIPETQQAENKTVKSVETKKSRRDYMKEYQRSYRKKKREEKAMNMNL